MKTATSEICPVAESERWSKLKTRNDVEEVSPELLAPNTNFVNKDLYHKFIYNPGYNYYDMNTDPVGPWNIKTSDAGLMRSYNGLLYPYSYPEMAASFKPYPVRYLPPVYLKNYETWPRNMASERDLYVRTPRMLRSDDDFWEQLQNDSIMKNILPTMPIPFLRSASTPSDTSYQYSSSPYGSQDCPLPIMLLCTPKISLSENLLNYNKQMDEVPYAYLNRQIDDYSHNKNSESSVENT
ncbi:unnamed protein product, partial [Brenthis ino]